MQNLNLRSNLKFKYNIKSLNYIQQNFTFQASFLFCYNYVCYVFDMISDLKVIKLGNDCIIFNFELVL